MYPSSLQYYQNPANAGGYNAPMLSPPGMSGFIDDIGGFFGGILHPSSTGSGQTPGYNGNAGNPNDPQQDIGTAVSTNGTVPNTGTDAEQPMDTTTIILYGAVALVGVYVLYKVFS